MKEIFNTIHKLWDFQRPCGCFFLSKPQPKIPTFESSWMPNIVHWGFAIYLRGSSNRHKIFRNLLPPANHCFYKVCFRYEEHKIHNRSCFNTSISNIKTNRPFKNKHKEESKYHPGSLLWKTWADLKRENAPRAGHQFRHCTNTVLILQFFSGGGLLGWQEILIIPSQIFISDVLDPQKALQCAINWWAHVFLQVSV